MYCYRKSILKIIIITHLSKLESFQKIVTGDCLKVKTSSIFKGNVISRTKSSK